MNLLRVGLAKMVGANWLHPNLGGLQFWKAFPNKYLSVRSYERSKVNQYIYLYKIGSYIDIIMYIISFQVKKTPEDIIKVAGSTGKKRPRPSDSSTVNATKAKKQRDSPNVVADVAMQDVHDEFDDEIPSSQAPPSLNKKRPTRGKAGTAKKPPLKKQPVKKQAAARKSASSPPPKSRPASAVPPTSKVPAVAANRTKINMTQKRKENIIASFMEGLNNMGIPETMRRTAR